MIDVNQDIAREAILALERGNKIEAIKCVRLAQGVGLKEAKDIVEEFIAANPNIKSSMQAANTESGKGFFGWVAIISILGTLAYYLFINK